MSNDEAATRGDINKLSDKMDKVHTAVGNVRKDTAVINERLSNHLDWHSNAGKLGPIGSMVAKSIIGVLTFGILGIIALGIREWVSK